jgi:hypothetical protein
MHSYSKYRIELLLCVHKQKRNLIKLFYLALLKTIKYVTLKMQLV